MTFDEYQKQAEMTRVYKYVDAPEYLHLGLAGEVGELLSLRAKWIRDRTVIQFEAIRKEVGDCLWVLAMLCSHYGWSFNDIARQNLDKLASRAERGVIQGSGDER